MHTEDSRLAPRNAMLVTSEKFTSRRLGSEYDQVHRNRGCAVFVCECQLCGPPASQAPSSPSPPSPASPASPVGAAEARNQTDGGAVRVAAAGVCSQPVDLVA